METKRTPILRWNATATGVAVSLFVATILVAAYLDNGGLASSPAAIPVFVIGLGMFASLCHVRRWWTLFGGAAAGLALGVLSSVGLMTQDVYGIYPLVVDTMLLFFMLGALAGAFFEFVFFLHRLVHRGTSDEH